MSTPPTGPAGSRARTALGLRRRLRRLARRFTRHEVHLVYHPDYDRGLTLVPMDPQRADRVLAFLELEGLLREGEVVTARPASLANILRVHSHEYLESLAHPETLTRILGAAISERDVEGVLDAQRLMTGGTIQATRLALMTGGVALHLGGGFHHAGRDRGMAFCLYNDVAVAIARLRARGFSEPVLVVDLDLHDGNGTREIFAEDDSVHTYSVHNEHWGPVEALASTSIALGADVRDAQLLATLRSTLPELVASRTWGLAVYIAGADPAADDRLGNWRLSAAGMLQRDRLVLELLRSTSPPVPVAIVVGGGYGDDAWRYTARLAAWLRAGEEVEPPDTASLTLQRFRRLKARLDPATFTSEPGDYTWRLTEDDLVGLLPGVGGQTRFLRYFSRHGTELMLERFGLLALLRARGFVNPVVDLDLDHPVGQTLRLFSDPGRAELLLELRVRRAQRVVPGHELLVIEWLLLQNPRAAFAEGRRPLPGQRHPGLGLLREVLGWLVVLAEILELDGLHYVPSHYHISVLSRRLVPFLEPEHEALYRELEEKLANLPLAVASRTVEEGLVVDAESGEPVRWGERPMVLPVSERMRRRLSGPEYEARVAEARRHLSLEVVGVPAPRAEVLE